MNGIFSTGDASRPTKLTKFAKDFNSLFDRIDRLHEWRSTVVRDHLSSMGESGNVSVEEYLTAAVNGSPGKAAIFSQMCEYFGVGP